MSVESKQKLIILWEHELRKAAKLLREAFVTNDQIADLEDAGEPVPSELQRALSDQLNDALQGCRVALDGLDDDHPIAMVSRSDFRRLTEDAPTPREVQQ